MHLALIITPILRFLLSNSFSCFIIYITKGYLQNSFSFSNQVLPGIIISVYVDLNLFVFFLHNTWTGKSTGKMCLVVRARKLIIIQIERTQCITSTPVPREYMFYCKAMRFFLLCWHRLYRYQVYILWIKFLYDNGYCHMQKSNQQQRNGKCTFSSLGMIAVCCIK